MQMILGTNAEKSKVIEAMCKFMIYVTFLLSSNRFSFDILHIQFAYSVSISQIFYFILFFRRESMV